MAVIIFGLFTEQCFALNNQKFSDFEAKKPFIEQEIERSIPLNNNITYTEVPRGIILSVAQSELFEENSDKISQNGKLLLDKIGILLNNFENNCTIEAHTEEDLNIHGYYKTDWEISIVRANKVADYLSKIIYHATDRLFPVGFGKIMPFKENVAHKEFSDNRIDFVIFDYTVKR